MTITKILSDFIPNNEILFWGDFDPDLGERNTNTTSAGFTTRTSLGITGIDKLYFNLLSKGISETGQYLEANCSFRNAGGSGGPDNYHWLTINVTNNELICLCETSYNLYFNSKFNAILYYTKV